MLGMARMSDRDRHSVAGYYAADQITQAIQTLYVAQEQLESALASIANAVGGSDMESAANALNFTAGAKERISEQLGALEEAHAELQRYMNGF